MLRARRASTHRRKSDLSIAIKPDLDVFASDASTGADPGLVETLIARLRDAGYPKVVVCDGRNRPDGWLHNRDALCVPDLLGYSFEAPAGVPYEVSWVDDNPKVVPLSSADRTEALQVPAAWVDADVRISFAKAKTDDAWAYALTLANLLGLVSARGDAAQWNAEDAVLHLMRRVPPHMALIDALVGSHGRAGSRVSLPIATDTIIASPNALLADWVGALKMGTDPLGSPLNTQALTRLGLPNAWALHGDASPWPGWVNPAPMLIEAVRGRARWPELDAFARAVLQPTDREHFPFRDALVDQMSSTVLRWMDGVTDQRAKDSVDLVLAGALSVLAGARYAFTSNVTKDDVIQSVAPLLRDVDALTPKDFRKTATMVAAQARVLEGTPQDARGFRFRTIGGHIHFAAARMLPIAFDDFVARVDVSASIRHMNDYVGGSWAVVEADELGRPLRQAERNIYLPQPNWTGIFVGRAIDEEKVEQMSYAADRHEIRWRTVNSPNGSAESDDGSVVFARTGTDQVEVRFFARQLFRLPSVIAAAHVERWPAVHGELVADAYGRFVDGTMSNFRAAYEGRPYRIGKAGLRRGVMAEGSELRTLLTGALAVVSRVFGWSSPDSTPSTGRVSPLFVDHLGFAHFAGPSVQAMVVDVGSGSTPAGDVLTPMGFLSELGRAVGKDIAAFGVPGVYSASGGVGSTRPGSVA